TVKVAVGEKPTAVEPLAASRAHPAKPQAALSFPEPVLHGAFGLHRLASATCDRCRRSATERRLHQEPLSAPLQFRQRLLGGRGDRRRGRGGLGRRLWRSRCWRGDDLREFPPTRNGWSRCDLPHKGGGDFSGPPPLWGRSQSDTVGLRVGG